MQHFRTELPVQKNKNTLQLNDTIITLGSCFADTIGRYLKRNKFSVLPNPFGTSYNPLAIHNVLRYSLAKQLPTQNSYIQNQDIYLNYNFHSSLSALSQPALENTLAETIGKTHQFLKEARWLMITYGTAWIYLRKDTGEVVANCHKIPSHQFEKELCTQKRMLDSFEELYTKLKTFNPNLNIILTVSPVRHLKDTLELNSVSKSVLRLSCYTLTQQYADVHYFPAYEILLDDLRDYRFYKSDMIHPSADAEEYIWTKFCMNYFDENTLTFLEKWKKIRSGLQHKPFHLASSAHQTFLRGLLAQLKEVSNFVSVDEEIESIKNQLI